jgi:hypothetical protein
LAARAGKPDGGQVRFKPLAGLTLTAAYIDNISTVFGPERQVRQQNNPARSMATASCSWPHCRRTGGDRLCLLLDSIAVDEAATSVGTLSRPDHRPAVEIAPFADCLRRQANKRHADSRTI